MMYTRLHYIKNYKKPHYYRAVAVHKLHIMYKTTIKNYKAGPCTFTLQGPALNDGFF